MTTNTLHIVNGDSTAAILQQSSLSGHLLVWREMLCEGPLAKNIDSDLFWTQRYAYFEENYQISRIEYFDKTIKEILKIHEIADYEEVVLWFEYDLFCQINLLGLLTYLLNYYNKSVRYRLVCVGHKSLNNKHLLSDYSPEEYSLLYENRLKISRNDLRFAQEAWQVYATNKKEQLKSFDFSVNKKFPYLSKAIAAHLNRFPDKTNLNQQQKKILSLIAHQKLTKKDLLHQLLTWQREKTVYGFGDLQYDKMIDHLKPYYDVEDTIYVINKLGLNLLS